jgi:outer membrane protein
VNNHPQLIGAVLVAAFQVYNQPSYFILRRKDMKLFKLKFVTGALMTAGLMLGVGSALAYQAGDFVVRAGAAGVLPTGESDEITAIASGAEVEAQDTWSLGLTFTYMATDNLGVGLLAAWPFEHDIDASGSISGLGTVGETKQLPPTVTLQYHFNSSSALHPYVGAGLNYTTFFSEDTEGALSGTSLELDDSWGLAGELGLDYDLGNDWLVSGQVWYIDIDTDATVSGVGSFDVGIDPWVVMLGVGKKF